MLLLDARAGHDRPDKQSAVEGDCSGSDKRRIAERVLRRDRRY